jgi:predicted phage terminase large subunit-like protein
MMATALRLTPDMIAEMRQEKARRHLISFIQHIKKDYLAGWFHKKLGRVIEKFLADCIAGKSPRLIIEAPPRSGKTEEASRYFPAYALGKYPDLDIIATSYSSDLASSINRDIQRIIDTDEYHELFLGTRLWCKNIRTVAGGSYLRNSDVFEVVNHKGVYKSAGRGAGITGRGARVILVDDPLKDAEEAGSETVRQSCWDWFTSTLYTRLMPGGGIIVIATRWHMDDLIGRLRENMKKGGEQWQVFSFPAVAEKDEYDDETGELLRHEGEALHPERYPLELLMKIKLGTSDDPGVGSRVWASLYQQHPTAREGGIFKREWWKFLKPPRLIHEMQNNERSEYFKEIGIRRIIQRWDTALGEKKQNDYTACCTLGIAGSRYYVLDVWQDKLQFPDVGRTVELRFDDWHPTKVCIEGGGSASGKATVQALKRTTHIPLFETLTTTDKTLRAEAVSPNVESGLVYFFEGSPWVSKFIDHCADFPNIKNDDDIDAFIGALEEVTSGRKPMQIASELLAAVGAR